MQRLRQGDAEKGAELSTERGGAIAVWFVDIVGIDARAALEVKQPTFCRYGWDSFISCEIWEPKRFWVEVMRF